MGVFDAYENSGRGADLSRIIGTGCFIVETYKVSEEIIETELIKIWYTLL